MIYLHLILRAHLSPPRHPCGLRRRRRYDLQQKQGTKDDETALFWDPV
ncbi:hypothetical protein I7I48_10110 [Histoplasma ohiense]|nr:hypothetical protein I7I48_10110 [Histoplasma ohiense (nom. inval.)]